MPYQIVLTPDLGAHVTDTINAINAGVLALWEQGIDAQMPEEVQFNPMVIRQPQALAIVNSNVRSNQRNEGGSNTVNDKSLETTTMNGGSLQTPNEITKTQENGTQTTVQNTSDVSNQTTTHGETIATTDLGQTEYQWQDTSTGTPSTNFLGLQAQPFPV